MALENFTLGMEGEKYFPPQSNYMEIWCAPMEGNNLIAVFYRTDTPDIVKPYIVTVRNEVPPGACTHEELFRCPRSHVSYMEEVSELDPMMLKCLALEGVPTEVT